MAKSGKPNILILWGDDIGWWNISYNNRGQMGYRTPNIDRIGNEGCTFTDYYGQQSCTAGRAAFVTGQNPIRTGLTKVGMPGANVGIRAEDPTIAELLKHWDMQPGTSARIISETRTNTYWDWVISHAYLLYGMQALVAQQIDDFEKFRPRQSDSRCPRRP